MRCVFGDPKKAPPPLERLSSEEVVSFLWNGEGSLVDELLQCMAPHMEDSMLSELKLKIHAHDPSGTDDIHKELQKSLLWLASKFFQALILLFLFWVGLFYSHLHAANVVSRNLSFWWKPSP